MTLVKSNSDDALTTLIAPSPLGDDADTDASPFLVDNDDSSDEDDLEAKPPPVPKEVVQGPKRNRIGAPAALFNSFKKETLETMDSTFAVQQYIQQTLPASIKEVTTHVACPAGQDTETWQYEMMR